MFSRKNQIFSSAVVTVKEKNKNLALELWKTNSRGETWEYLYFLDMVKPQAIPYSLFNKAAGYKDNFIIRGFNVLLEDQSANILEAFDLESRVYYPEVSKEEFNKAVKVLAENFGNDKQTTTAARTEQGYLRRNLFKNKRVSLCGICGREMLVEFLVAAHIKKRSECSIDERRDVENIVMPMCRLGCDDLFERGYIAVGDGMVMVSELPCLPKAMTDYFSLIKGRACSFWNDSTRKYFSWHKDNVFV